MDPIRIVLPKLIWAKFKIEVWRRRTLPEKKWGSLNSYTPLILPPMSLC